MEYDVDDCDYVARSVSEISAIACFVASGNPRAMRQQKKIGDSAFMMTPGFVRWCLDVGCADGLDRAHSRLGRSCPGRVLSRVVCAGSWLWVSYGSGFHRTNA